MRQTVYAAFVIIMGNQSNRLIKFELINNSASKLSFLFSNLINQ